MFLKNIGIIWTQNLLWHELVLLITEIYTVISSMNLFIKKLRKVLELPKFPTSSTYWMFFQHKSAQKVLKTCRKYTVTFYKYLLYFQVIKWIEKHAVKFIVLWPFNACYTLFIQGPDLQQIRLYYDQNPWQVDGWCIMRKRRGCSTKINMQNELCSWWWDICWGGMISNENHI